MIHYRIKIEQLINGKTRYVPQEGYLRDTGGWIRRMTIYWSDVYKGGFDTEEEAISAMDGIRKYREKKEGEQVKSVTYKNI
jgi:hypothetical protein